MNKFIDLTGQSFGNWLVIKRAEDYVYSNGNKKIQWLCECKCENKTKAIILTDNLRSGKSTCCVKCRTKKVKEKERRYNTYNLSGDYGIGYTSNGEEFWFDLEDYDLIKNYCWHLDSAGYICANEIGENKQQHKTIKLHRLIMKTTDPKIQVDHIKHKLYDNRKSELRLVNNAKNQWNKGLLSTNTSGYTGVSLYQNDKMWHASIEVDGKKINLGSYKDFNEAVKARKEAEKKYFGKYSYDNSMELDKD